MKLHGGSVDDKVPDKVIGHLRQVLHDFDGTIIEVGFVILDLPFLAKGLDQTVCLGQVVSGNHGEQVVIDLVLKTTTEPINKGLGKSVSSSDVSGSCHLKLPEVGTSFGVVDSHTVVAQSEDDGKEGSR